VPPFLVRNSFPPDPDKCPGENGKRDGETNMRYFCTLSLAVRLGFWLFTSGVVLGLILGLQV
jgi:hypothetical protein